MDDGSALQIAPVNAAVPDDVKVLIKQRYEEMKEWLFEPFTGPIRDNQGKLVLKEGERMDNQGIENLSFLIEGVEGELPA
jgi:basic membrane lipoprotein Med (substrate-binding protein (PBP1-ABC) superfamily)